jgi:hypothetical protein
MANAKPVHSEKPEPAEKKDPKDLKPGEKGYTTTLPSGAVRKDN